MAHNETLTKTSTDLKTTKLLEKLIDLSKAGVHVIFPKEWLTQYSTIDAKKYNKRELKVFFCKHFKKLSIDQIKYKIQTLPEEKKKEFINLYINRLEDEILHKDHMFH
jgi:hypothetical protein